MEIWGKKMRKPGRKRGMIEALRAKSILNRGIREIVIEVPFASLTGAHIKVFSWSFAFLPVGPRYLLAQNINPAQTSRSRSR